MARGRPAGYKKINGIWMSKEVQAAMNVTPSVTSTHPATVAEKPTQSVTDVSQHIGSSLDDMLSEDGILDHCTQVAIERVTDVQAKTLVQGVMTYSRKEIDKIEAQTGLVYSGTFAMCDGDKYSGELVPVFLRADHTEEKHKEDLMKIRKGV